MASPLDRQQQTLEQASFCAASSQTQTSWLRPLSPGPKKSLVLAFRFLAELRQSREALVKVAVGLFFCPPRLSFHFLGFVQT